MDRTEVAPEAAVERLDEFWEEVMSGEREVAAMETAASPLERIEMVRAGVPAEMLEVLATRLDVSLEWVYETTGVARSTGDRKRRRGERLNQDQSERIMGLIGLIGQVERIVHESGDPEGFDAARWVADWLDAPLGALGGRRPADLMDTADGRTLVTGLVRQMQAGTYA